MCCMERETVKSNQLDLIVLWKVFLESSTTVKLVLGLTHWKKTWR